MRECALTLGYAICESTRGDRPPDHGRDVDDDTSFFCGPRREVSFIRVLRIDGIGNAGIDDECSSRIDVHGPLEILGR
jgi:hypothetical protein